VADQPKYVPLRNAARQYVDTGTGEVISRRQYQKSQHGGTTPEKVAHQTAMRLHAEQIEVEVDRNTGRVYRRSSSGARIALDPLRRYRGIIADYKETHPGARVRGPMAQEWRELLGDLASKDNDPNGRKARALVAIGRRDAGAPYDVGDTPDDDADGYDPNDDPDLYFDDVDEDAA
jgi:hypothetical protein